MSLQKGGNILITSEDFVKGMSLSPYLGIQQMVNLDIHSRSGALRIMRALEEETVTGLEAKMRFGGIQYQSGDFYGLDNSGNLFRRTSGGTWSDEHDFGTDVTDGGFVWKDWFIALESGTSAKMVAYGPLTGSPDEETFTNISFNHSAGETFSVYIDKDDRVFIGADNVLHELIQVDGQDFDPTDSNTYSLSEEVLILPEGVNIEGITEVGTNLVIATSYGNNKIVADIFVWNPNKSGTDSAAPDSRIALGGAGVRQIGFIDNIVYALTGLDGTLKQTDLTAVQRLYTFNDLLNDQDEPLNYGFPSQSTAEHDGGLIFGLSKDDAPEPNIFFYKDGALSTFTTSQGQIDDGQRIGKVQSLDSDTLLVAWESQASGTPQGVDVTGTNRYSDYSAYFISQLYNVGQHMRGKTYQHIGFTLGKNLVDGQGIRIKYRTDLSDDWTTLGTWDFDTIGGVSAYEDKANLPSDLTNLQLRVEMTTDDNTTPELLSVYVV